MREPRLFAPAGVLALGAGLLLTVQTQRSLPLQRELTELVPPVRTASTYDVPVDTAQLRVARFTTYLNRVYVTPDTTTVAVFVGYYDSQSQGKTVHSPKNCLPGAGWEPSEKPTYAEIPTAGGSARVNRYLLANGGKQALVYYWYQGRGRVAANEYLVKLDLLRDAAFRRRTDEALVRIVIPVRREADLAAADALARRTAATLITSLDGFLPT